MPRAKALIAATLFDGKIYIFGGQNQRGVFSTSNVDIYDPINNTWDTISAPDIPVTLSNAHAHNVVSKIFISGGMEYYPTSDGDVDFSDEIYVFDPVNLTWELGGRLPIESSYHCSTVWDAKIYNFGLTNLAANNSTIVYNPELNTFDTLANYIGTRAFSNATVLNNHIYLQGGINIGASIKTLSKNDPVNDSWEIMEPLPEDKWWHGSATISQTLYIFGGLQGSVNNSSPSPGLWLYQWGNDSWVDTEKDMPEGLIGFSTVVFEQPEGSGCIYTFGGATENFFNNTAGEKVSSKVYKFCPSASTSSLIDPNTEKLNLGISPNPVSENSVISFVLKFPENVSINVYDMAGKRIAVIADGNFASGENQIKWLTQKVSPGLYMIECKTETKTELIKCIVQ